METWIEYLSQRNVGAAFEVFYFRKSGVNEDGIIILREWPSKEEMIIDLRMKPIRTYNQLKEIK
tara:strand:+ start:236 stop:427 length:192 start_codon:yes stop_codon:yes gene_type:complete